MKKILILMCLIIFFLAGCQKDTDGASENPNLFPDILETVQKNPAELKVNLVSNSQMERMTSGAVQTFQLPFGKLAGMTALDDDMLLLTESNGTYLTRLKGPELCSENTRNIKNFHNPAEFFLEANENGIAFFDPKASKIIVLSGNFEERARYTVPRDLKEPPCISSDHEFVYYTSESDVRVLNLKNGISRLLKQTDLAALHIADIYDDRKILKLDGKRNSGETVSMFLSAETGETLYKSESSLELVVSGDQYYFQEKIGMENQLSFGILGEDPRCLHPEETGFQAIPIPEWNGYLTISNTKNGTLLSYYDLQTGYRTSAVLLPGNQEPVWIQAEPRGRRIFFQTMDNQASFYGWDLTKTQTRKMKNHTDVQYTEGKPDIKGLENCEEWARRLSKKYGVNFQIWKNAANLSSASEEYQVSVYRRILELLDRLMEKFPKDFFKDLAEGTTHQILNINLVRSADDTSPEGGALIWNDGDAYLILETEGDVEKAFYREISHMIDNRVIGSCVLYDDWNDMNPSDFSYDFDYAATAVRDGTIYLDGEDRAFTDIYSMSFPKEDRAGIFEYAMKDGKRIFFSSEIMQNKLRRMCLGIREAFGLNNVKSDLPWEQYLSEPLA